MSIVRRLVASFAGSGTFGATPFLRLLEGLEQRRVEYHKAVAGGVEIARERLFEDQEDPLEPGGFTTRTIQVGWENLVTPAPLDDRGLDGLRSELETFPAGIRGLRIRLGYAFPKREPEPVLLTVMILDGQRWEVRLSFDGARVLDVENKALARANGLMVADLAEAMYDVLDPPYGAIRLDAGVLPDQLPQQGWSFLCGNVVERAGRAAVEAYAKRCAKSWQLADGGWFLAPVHLDESEGELTEARQALLSPCRHLNLEGMRVSTWKAS